MQALDLPNLRDAPFRMGIGPGDAVEHRPWRKARDRILALLADRPAHVALLGTAGSGKTLLLHALARTVQDQGRAVRVVTHGGMLPALEGDAVLLVDDAEHLEGDALARLAAWEGSCVLAGPPALAECLPKAFATVVLSSLSPDDVARFVAARLAVAGQRRDLLQPDAVLALARLSGGAPRQINALAGAAVFLAGLDDSAEVGQHHVEEAAALRDGDAPPAPPPARNAPVEANAREPASEPASPPQPALPLTPRRADRPRLTVAAAGAVIGLLLLLAASAALVGHPGKAPRLQVQTASTTGPGPSPPPKQPQQEAALVKPPVAAQPSADASSAPAVAVREMPAPASHPPAPPAVPPREVSVTPEPAINSPRVVVQYRGGAAAEADRFAKALAGSDPKFSHVETRAVSSTPRAPTIRFFHPEDVGAAWELEAAVSATGGAWEVRNFTGFQPRPRRGTLEVWLP